MPSEAPSLLIRDDLTVCSVRESYLDRCNSMTFLELREYIDKCLASGRTSPGLRQDGPRTRDQFLRLQELLVSKIDLKFQPAAARADPDRYPS
ncbi:MAG: hypothetical protein ACYTFI_25385, partial [Planctomycetota bacterium]